MAPEQVKQPRKINDTFAVSAMLILACGCAILLMSQGRALAPHDLPVLSLPAEEVAAVRARDRAVAKTASTGPAAVELDRLLLEQGSAEREVTEELTTHLARRNAFRAKLKALLDEAGPQALVAQRARAVQRLLAALDLRLPQEQVGGVMGSFANVLEENHVTRNAEVVAPEIIVTILYKARWNVLHSLPPDYAFAPVERRAYHGWLALHADGQPIADRLEALERYAAEGGERAAEARGILAFRGYDYKLSARELQRAYELTGRVRLRNYVLGARIAAGLTD